GGGSVRIGRAPAGGGAGGGLSARDAGPNRPGAPLRRGGRRAARGGAPRAGLLRVPVDAVRRPRPHAAAFGRRAVARGSADTPGTRGLADRDGRGAVPRDEPGGGGDRPAVARRGGAWGRDPVVAGGRRPAGARVLGA